MLLRVVAYTTVPSVAHFSNSRRYISVYFTGYQIKVAVFMHQVTTERCPSQYAIAVPFVSLSVTFVHLTQPVEIFGSFYRCHPLTFKEIFTVIVPENPYVGGFKRKRGSEML